ncbi:MAG TPA: tRNA (adenine-N1)-methyltransferase, partial [Thermoplasmatales archaeon]|nr:tRNA (adenine-N1)-methyltransferase [Thermoplasmatales archaeon]
MIIERDDIVVLIDEKGKRCMVNVDGKTRKIKGFGVINPQEFVGLEYGKKIVLGTKNVWLLRPSSYDRWGSLKRKAQIILPKDAAQIIVNCSIVSGSIVVEGGIG